MNVGGGSVVKPMSSSTGSKFPVGLRVLVVDDDPTCLAILEKMLRNCHYQATKCNRAEVALSLLRENKNGFDIVISDVHMPDMDGFKLLEHIGLEMDLPVIMMSGDDSQDVVMKGVTHGAYDYLIKPVRIEALKNIWQHVVRKNKHEWKDHNFDQSASIQQLKPPEDADYSSSANEGNWKNSKKRKEEEEDDDDDDKDDTSTLKKPRVVWSIELHQQFVQAVHQLGIDKAVPKKILELMNVPGLTRENVASHLQKYRLYLRRLSGVSQHQSGLNSSFLGRPETTFGTITSLSGLDLQIFAAGQLPVQSLANLQAAAVGRSATTSAISMPLVDQRNPFSFESNNSNKQIDLLHGIPTTMVPKQLANLHHPSHSFVGMNMQVHSTAQHNNSLLMHVSQTQPRAQILNGVNNGSIQVSGLPLSMQKPLSSEGGKPVLAQSSIVDNAQGNMYNLTSQVSPMADFSLNQSNELQTYSFSLANNRGMLQEELNSSNIKGGFPLSYDIFNELHQHKSQNWGLQDVGSTFDASRHHSSLNGTQGVLMPSLSQKGFSSTHNSEQGRNAPPIGKPMYSNRGNSMGGPQLNSLSGNMPSVKSERFPESTIFEGQFGQDELMSAFLKQQGSVGTVETEFGFDGYTLENLPV